MTRVRRWLLSLHRYTGLSVGFVLVLLGLSGSVITYQQELDALLHPDLLTTPSRGTPVALDQLASAARASLPHGATLQWARLPHEPGHAVSWFYRDRDFKAWELTIDPYTARVLGQRRSDTHALALIYELHATLYAGVAGNIVLGIVALAMLLFIGVGLWLWWPRRGKWRQALTIKHGVGSARLHFDLHRVTGAYVAPLLLVVAFSGIYMAVPPVMNALVSLIAPVTEPASVRGTGGTPSVTLDAVVAAAQRYFPGARPKVLVLPDGPDGVYEISLYRPGDRLWRKSGEWIAFIDPATGEARHLVSPLSQSSGDRFIAWMFPLHNGEAFGEMSRAVVCFIGLVPLLLAITGLSIWLRKRSVRQRTRHRACKP